MRNQVSSNLKKRNDFRCSGKLRGHGGFTLAELLIVIAIILILAGFGFVSVIQNQRRLRLREMDDIARQIFIAAQNHLTVAEASGQWDYEKLTAGKEEALTDEEKEKINKKINNRLGPHNDLSGSYEKIQNAPEVSGTERKHDYRVITSNLGTADGSVIDMILPFGAIDETLKGRRFIILYDAKTATINGVYYSEYDEDLDFTNVTNDIYTKYIYPTDDRGGRLASASTRLIGWYGPGKAEGVDDSGLYRPIVTVENAENLVLKIVDRNIDNPTVIDGTDTALGAKTKVRISYKGLSSNAEVTKEIWSQGEDSSNPNNSSFKNSSSEVSRLDANWSANKGSITNPSDPPKPQSVWNYSVYLDSVTVNKGHFADIFTNFIPGEDIEISVSIVYENGGSSKESKAAVVKTNSLFGSLSSSGTDKTVTVANGRHLQNLSYDISHVGYISTKTDEKNADLVINKASIIYGVSWKEDPNPNIEDFIGKIIASGYYSGEGGVVNVYNFSSSESSQGNNKFSAIRNKNLTEINGNMNELINFEIVASPGNSGTPSGSAGLIGKVETNDFTVSNLIMINPEVTSESDAGALIGTFAPTTTDKNLTITSCAAYNAAYDADTKKWNNFTGSSQSLTISSTGGHAGGLVGSMTAGTITNSVASLYVKASETSSGNAGGLVGTCTGNVSITHSYAGGHTAGSANSDIDKIGYYEDVPNKEVSNETARGRYNVISAGGSAGGLIGSYTDETDDAITITRCYSTASASGTSAAGGLIGTAAGTVAANNSYCTGRVGGSAVDAKKGQFIGTGTLTSGTGNLYFSIVNNDMKAIGGVNTDPTGLTALDANLTTYNDFVSIGKMDETGASVAADAKPYDGGLTKLYEGKYALKTISQLGGPSPTPTGTIPEWLTTHYGDWPAPETLVVNVPAKPVSGD